MNHSEPSTARWTRGICEANALRIQYVRTGDDKPALIALHGLGGNGACWTPVARSLEDEYDVIMPDARGHGRSSAPRSGYTYADHASDVVGLIKGLGLMQPVLLGHSMGGMTAAVVASQLESAVRAVVLVEPTFISPQWQREVFESDVVEQHRQFLRSEPDDLLSQARIRNPHRSPEMIKLVTEARLQTQIQAFEVLAPPNPDYRELVRNIRVPVFLVIGSTGIVSLETALELQQLNPRLSYEVVPEAGHGLPYDQPERLGVIVQSFLEGIPK